MEESSVSKIITEEQPDANNTDYSLFIKATEEGDQERMKKFIDLHPEALKAQLFPDGRTALHYSLSFEGPNPNMRMWLVDQMTKDDLEIKDWDGYTALGVGAGMDYPGVLDILHHMVKRNPELPNIYISYSFSFPIMVASKNGCKDTTRYLYYVTDANILSPKQRAQLLDSCIKMKTFDIALDLLQRFPDILHDIYFDWEAMVQPFSQFSSESEHHQSGCKKISEKSNDDEKRFFQLVLEKVSTFKAPHVGSVYPAIIYAAEHGKIEFITEMIRANPDLLHARDRYDKYMFWYAVENRQEKVFNLIYAVKSKHVLLSCSYLLNMNILHSAAELPPPDALYRVSSSPALQMQREVLWFKEVWSLVEPHSREQVNWEGLTGRQLFCRRHEKLIEAGEKSMKETATSSTVVGALILTIMFAAAFTVPGGNDQTTGYPIFANKVLFKLFIVCDVLSLSSSATSILVFLTILTNSHGDEDFVFNLPRRLMIGVLTLFFSIATMMITFCFALALMLDGELQFIIPIALITSVPVFVFTSSMFRLLSKIFVSTFGSSIFDRNTKLPTPRKKERDQNTMSYGNGMV